jgi:hypothetical protein
MQAHLTPSEFFPWVRKSSLGMWSRVCLLMAVASGSIAYGADKYQELPLKEPTRQERSLADNFNRAKSPASAEANAALAKHVSYLVSRLTQAAETQGYTQNRRNIELLLAERNQPAEARKVIVDTLIRWAGGVATKDTFSPASRINCVAILAMLDEAPENSRDSRPPLPARDAFPVLKGLAADPQVPAEIKAVAMVGLERHMRVYWNAPRVLDEAKKADLQKLATDMINSQPRSALDQASHSWLVRRAYDMLSAVKAPTAIDVSIVHLSDPTMLPSVRLSALQYLSELDASTFTPEQQRAYLIGMAHFLRSQLVDWYEFEEDIIKRDTNAGPGGMGGMGGMGGDMGGYGGGMGGMGGYGGGMGDMGDMGGYGGGMGGGDMGGYGGGAGGMGGYGGGMGGMGGGSPTRAKPVDLQDWKTRKSRRYLNMVSQQVHVALDGKPLAKDRARVQQPLQSGNDAQILAQINEMLTLVEDFQTAINEPTRISKINTLLNASKVPIENIMDFVVKIPGFTDRYPELAGDEKLDDVPEAPAVDDPTMPLGGQEGEAPPGEQGDGEDA